MKLIFLHGLPATGKLTVARELAANTGYKLFHNHLAVDLLLSVFEFGSQPFVELREEIWLGVFRQARRIGVPGLILRLRRSGRCGVGSSKRWSRLSARLSSSRSCARWRY